MNVLKYPFPLSKAMGKIYIKEQFAFSDYGIPIAPTQTIITPKHYIEWQIGYDRVVSDLLLILREKQFAVGTISISMLYFCSALSSLKDCNNQSFIGRNIQSNECGYLEITKENIIIFIQIFRIFGLLSSTSIRLFANFKLLVEQI